MNSESGTPGTVPKDDPLTKFVARLIEASKATGRTDAVLADEIFKVARSNVTQIRQGTLGVGKTVAERVALSLGVEVSDLHSIAEAIEGDPSADLSPLLERLAGHKRVALPWLASGKELSVTERAIYEEALRLIEQLRSSDRPVADLRRDAGDLLMRAKREAPRGVARVAKKRHP